MKISRDKLVAVWNDTKKYCEELKLLVQPSLKININLLPNVGNNPNDHDIPMVKISNVDCLNMALQCVNTGMNPMVLNMASDYTPGGGVSIGCPAQEEEIFRCSNAHMTHPIIFYPLANNEVIYSPQVTIVKNGRANNYSRCVPFTVGMIACAAIRDPVLVDGKYCENDYRVMYEKIKSLFIIGIHKKHDALVLGAFGCGAFNNPPHEVANLFYEMVRKYGKYFKFIGFPILCVRKTDENNLIAFRQKFT